MRIRRECVREEQADSLMTKLSRRDSSSNSPKYSLKTPINCAQDFSPSGRGWGSDHDAAGAPAIRAGKNMRGLDLDGHAHAESGGTVVPRARSTSIQYQ